MCRRRAPERDPNALRTWFSTDFSIARALWTRSSGHPGIVRYAHDRGAIEARRRKTWACAQVSHDGIPDGLARSAFGDGRPAGHLVAAARIERLSAEREIADAPTDRLPRLARIAQAADPHHVAALLVIGIGIEEVVADVLEDILDRGAGHL